MASTAWKVGAAASTFSVAEGGHIGQQVQVFDWIVEQGGERLDKHIAARHADLSRTRVQQLIAEGHVTVNGAVERASYKVQAGDAIRLTVPPVRPARLKAEAIPLAIVYEDADLLVIDKPAGMVVHPAPGHSEGTLVAAVLAHCPNLAGVGGEMRPGIVHRLDKDTSGLILVAKHDAAYRDLQAQFKSRTVEKVYLALVDGHPPPRGRIEAPIGRDPHHRQRMAVVPQGRPAFTEYRVIREYGPYSLLEVTLLTGRTHQIRAHLSWLKHPLVGDRVYGRRPSSEALPRQFLHAHRLAFRLPSTHYLLRLVSPLPEDLAGFLRSLSQFDNNNSIPYESP